jgi:hypothetical protein
MCDTQWRVGAQGVFIGLDYGVLFRLMDLYEVEDQLECFEKVRIVESEALDLIMDDMDKMTTEVTHGHAGTGK